MSVFPQSVIELCSGTVVIVGLGREGFSTYQFLTQHFPTTAILFVDDKPMAELSARWQTILKQGDHAVLSAKEIPSRAPTKEHVTLSLSPGIPPNAPVIQALERAFPHAKKTSNTDLFFKCACDTSTIIGVTGTKGKSTTASLIYTVLSDFLGTTHVFLGGNIGVPPLDVWEKWRIATDTHQKQPIDKTSSQETKKPIFVLELSSHQLSPLTVSPHIAVVQNVTPEHLDYYSSYEEYKQAKASITRFQTTRDTVIYNAAFSESTDIAHLSTGVKVDTSEYRIAPSTIKLKGKTVIERSRVQLPGDHNCYNILPALAIAKMYSIPQQRVQTSIEHFQPLAHRLEYVDTIKEVQYYNDSLSTTPDATIAALKSFPDTPVVLIAGGYSRGLSFHALAQELLANSVAHLVLFRPTGEDIQKELTKINPTHTISIVFVATMQQAAREAQQHASPGNIVLLSPGSPSFGTFTNYADRGNQFKQEVTKLKTHA